MQEILYKTVRLLKYEKIVEMGEISYNNENT